MACDESRSLNSADENAVDDVLHVLQEGMTATRKHPGGDPRMRLEGILASFVSTLANDNGRGNVDTCLVLHIPASAHARSSTRSVAGCNQVL